MKRITFLLALLVSVWSNAHAAPSSTNSAPADRILMIDPSSMRIGGGNATLIIGPLQRADGIYTGDYKLNVFPYFFKDESGRLAIVVSDATIAKVNQGKVVAITGIATTSGKGGKCRPIEATATATDSNHGTLKLWFTAGKRKMIFSPAYHLAGNGTTDVLAQTTDAKF
jgi:hypothetical protein